VNRGISDRAGSLLQAVAKRAEEFVSSIPRTWIEAILVVGAALGVVFLFTKNPYFGVGAVVSLIAGLFLLAKPILLIYLIFAFIPITWVNLLGRRFRVITFLTLAAFAYYLLENVVRKKMFAKDTVFFGYLLYVAACALSLTNSVDISQSFTASKYFLLSLMFGFALVAAVEEEKDLRVILWILLIWGAVQSVLAVLQSAVSPVFYPAYHFRVFGLKIVEQYSVGGIRRASGTFESGPRYAMFLLGPLAFVLTALWRDLWKKRALWLGALLLFIFGLFVSFTRAAIVFAGGYIFLYNVIERDWRRLLKSVAWIVLITIVAATAIYLLFPADVVEALGKRFQGEDDELYLDRFYFLYNAIRAFMENPLTGLGVGTYAQHSWDLMQKYPVPWESLALDINPLNMPYDVTVHNDYGRMLAETGILSLIAFVLIYVFSFRNYFYVVRHTRNELYKTTAIAFAMYLGVMIVYWYFHEYIMEEPYTAILPIIMSVVLKKLTTRELEQAEGAAD
jgi:O-antigen ligase